MAQAMRSPATPRWQRPERLGTLRHNPITIPQSCRSSGGVTGNQPQRLTLAAAHAAARRGTFRKVADSASTAVDTHPHRGGRRGDYRHGGGRLNKGITSDRTQAAGDLRLSVAGTTTGVGGAAGSGRTSGTAGAGSAPSGDTRATGQSTAGGGASGTAGAGTARVA